MDIDSKCLKNTKKDIYSLNLDLTYSSVENAITKIAEKEGYIRHDVYKKVLSTEGGNYLGVLYEIDIKGETAEGNKETNLFVKQVIPNSGDIKVLSVSEIYNRERYVYTELSEIFTELQNKVNIPTEEKFKLAKNYDKCLSDAIILENMTKQGFKIYDRMKVMKLNYAKLCVECLAKFHGLSFIIERKMPDYYENKLKSLNQQLSFDAEGRLFINSFYKWATKKLSPEQKIKADKWWERALEDFISKYLQGTMTDVKCVCHGDFKMNNIMYKDIGGEVTEVIAVDYQLTHYGSPILDLIYFLYTGTDQIFRKKHLAYLLDWYYISLEKYLGYFDVPVNDVYPRKMFENDFANCLDFALVTCIWVLPFIMISVGDDCELTDYDAIGSKFQDSYYVRLEGIFEDCFKWDG